MQLNTFTDTKSVMLFSLKTESGSRLVLSFEPFFPTKELTLVPKKWFHSGTALPDQELAVSETVGGVIETKENNKSANCESTDMRRKPKKD